MPLNKNSDGSYPATGVGINFTYLNKDTQDLFAFIGTNGRNIGAPGGQVDSADGPQSSKTQVANTARNAAKRELMEEANIAHQDQVKINRAGNIEIKIDKHTFVSTNKEYDSKNGFKIYKGTWNGRSRYVLVLDNNISIQPAVSFDNLQDVNTQLMQNNSRLKSDSSTHIFNLHLNVSAEDVKKIQQYIEGADDLKPVEKNNHHRIDSFAYKDNKTGSLAGYD